MNKKSHEKLSFYLDTNILIDIIRSRRLSSTDFFNKAISFDHRCVTSVFSFMEIAELEKSQSYAEQLVKQKEDINKICRSYRNCSLDLKMLKAVEDTIKSIDHLKEIEQISFDKDGWDEALKLAFSTNISAPDCIHIATFNIADVDYFVTSDSDLVKFAKEIDIECIRPKKALELLALYSKN